MPTIYIYIERKQKEILRKKGERQNISLDIASFRVIFILLKPYRQYYIYIYIYIYYIERERESENRKRYGERKESD